MRKLGTALVAAAIASSGLVATATPVSADTPGCVTFHEYDRIHRGMTKERVHRIFDTRGWFSDGVAGGYTRQYLRCSRAGTDATVAVTYRKDRGEPARVVEKRRL